MKKRKHMNLKQYAKMIKVRRESVKFDLMIERFRKINPKFLEFIEF